MSASATTPTAVQSPLPHELAADPPAAPEHAESSGPELVLHLFSGPAVSVAGERRQLPDSCQRLLVWLALRRKRVDRSVASGVLWPAVDDHRASGNLRSALWRLRGGGLDLVDTTNATLALRPEVTVDAHVASDWAHRLITGSPLHDDVRIVPWFFDAVGLLPGWDDDWAHLERERLRHRMLHAFELLSRRLSDAGRTADGVRAARLLIEVDPLRESGQCALVRAHLAAGAVAEARQVCQDYRRLHRQVFGVDPSPRLDELIALPPTTRLLVAP